MAAAAPRPLIFLGYVVTKPHAKRRSSFYPYTSFPDPHTTFVSAAPYEILISDGQVYDIHKADLDRWLVLTHYVWLKSS